MGLDIQVTYYTNRLKWDISAPVKFNYRSLAQKKQGINMQQQNFFPEPSMKLVYSFSSVLETSAYYALVFNTPNLSTLYGAYLLSDYRNLSAYEANLNEGMMHLGNLKLNYKNIPDMLFFGVTAAYNRYFPKILFGRNFEGILSKTITVETDGYGDSRSLSFRFSKGAFFASPKLELNLFRIRLL
jgi:hypothetical protein